MNNDNNEVNEEQKEGNYDDDYYMDPQNENTYKKLRLS